MSSPFDDPAEGYLSAESIADMPEELRKHPVDPDAIRHTRSLGDAVGLQRLGVHLVRLQPGRAASEFHFHHHEEEFVYVIAGRGKAEIGQQQIELAAGDFLGIPNGEPAHKIFNPYREDLYLLVAGERAAFDICDYPRAGKRLVRWREDGQPMRQFIDLDE